MARKFSLPWFHMSLPHSSKLDEDLLPAWGKGDVESSRSKSHTKGRLSRAGKPLARSQEAAEALGLAPAAGGHDVPAPSRTATGRRFLQPSSPVLAKQVVQLSCLCSRVLVGAVLPAGSREPRGTRRSRQTAPGLVPAPARGQP